ncbi:MAG: hypothetical protein JNJ73_12360 [Hyphomonadaceae bacterium]|nr:hypothetical protein [Hyphomonadaceae bacterium]
MREALRPNRRSFLAQVVGASVASGGALGSVTGWAQTPPRRSCLSDRDRSDRPHYGTLTGLTDRDRSDRAGRGTFDGVTDQDGGTDQPNRGVGVRCEIVREEEREEERRVRQMQEALRNSQRGGGRRGGGNGGGGNNGGGGGGRSGGGPPPVIASRSAPRERAAFPAFPWPPPAPSSRQLLPREIFIDARRRRPPTLMDVSERLTAALRRARYSEYSFYSVPSGFALVARLERFLDDGSRAPDNFRYLQPGDEPFSFTRYLTGLFVAPVGNYRQIAFIVTNAPFVASGKALSDVEAERILRSGANALPSTYRFIRFGPDYSVTALVYEFEKRPQEQALARPARGRLAAQVHLERSGIEPALERR